jgi:hypothetical protein
MPQMLDDERILIGRFCGRDNPARRVRRRRLRRDRRLECCGGGHLDFHSFTLPAWAVVDPHALPAQMNPGKSHQIVANETAPSPDCRWRVHLFANHCKRSASTGDRRMKCGGQSQADRPPANPGTGEGGLPGTRTINYQHQ